MGRNPKPVQLQLLEGNKNRKTKEQLDRLQKAEKSVQFESDKIKPPTWLNEEARKVFKKLVKDFDVTGLLVNVDIYALSMFCDAYSDYIRYTQVITAEGDMIEQTNKAGATNSIAHPLIAKKSQAFAQMERMMGKFGLNPVDRTKLIHNLNVSDDEEDEANPFSGRL